MLLNISDEQYLKYTRRLSEHIHGASDLKSLALLFPSIMLAQKQATNTLRTFKAMCLLQDFNHKTRMLDERV